MPTAPSVPSASDRRRRLLMYAGMQYASRVGMLAATLVTIPLAYGYLGTERFGVWMTISSFAGLLAFADFGLGNGLVNIVTNANAMGDRRTLRAAVASGYWCIGAIVVLCLCTTELLLKIFGTAALFRNLQGSALDEADGAVQLFVLLFFLNLPATLVSKVQHGLQRGYVGSAWQAAGAVATIALVYSAVRLHLGLRMMVAALYAPPLVMGCLNSYFWFRGHPETRPAFDQAQRALVAQVLSTGFLFFALQLAAAVTYQSDSLLLASLLGPQTVANYAVGQRIFAMLSSVVAMSTSGLWPSYGDALARKDFAWIIRAFKLSLLGTVLFGLVGSAGLAWQFDTVVRLWTHQTIALPRPLVFAFATWAVLEMTGSTCAALLNGAGILKLQVWVAAAMATCALVGKILLIPVYGPLGAILPTIVSYAAISGTFQLFFFRRYLATLGSMPARAVPE